MTAASVGHQCPECVAQGRRSQRPVRTAFGGSVAGRSGAATKTLVGLNVVVAVISIATGGVSSIAGGGLGGLLGRSTPLTDWGSVLGLATYGGAVHGIAHGEYYRLITAMFLHYGLLHLLLNMYALWLLGVNLERALGPLRFTALYLLAGLGGNVAAYLFAAPNTPTAGASTAVFGVMAGIFVILKRMRLSVAPIVPVIVINVIFTLTIANISKSGHLGGLAVGAIVAAILAYAPRAHRNLIQGVGCGLVLLVLLVLTVYRTMALT